MTEAARSRRGILDFLLDYGPRLLQANKGEQCLGWTRTVKVPHVCFKSVIIPAQAYEVIGIPHAIRRT